MVKNFGVMLSSDSTYECLVSEIYYKGDFAQPMELVARLTQEEGFEKLKIEFYPRKDDKVWIFDLEEFENAIIDAKNFLKEG